MGGRALNCLRQPSSDRGHRGLVIRLSSPDEQLLDVTPEGLEASNVIFQSSNGAPPYMYILCYKETDVKLGTKISGGEMASDWFFTRTLLGFHTM